MNRIAFMFSGTAAGAVKPENPVIFKIIDFDWLRVSVFHDVRGATQPALHLRTNTRLQPLSAASMSALDTKLLQGRNILRPLLDNGVHTRGFECALAN